MAALISEKMYGDLVKITMKSMRDGVGGIAGARDCIKRFLTDPDVNGCRPWQNFVMHDTGGNVLVDHRHQPLQSFREFLELKPLKGLGTKLADVERLLADDPEALALLREAVTEKHGGGDRNPEGANQYKGNNSVKTNNVSLDQPSPDLFTPPPEKPKRKTQQGNAKAYTLSRLKKQSPALFERVKAGELSANAAAIEAGFRRPPSPSKTVRNLLPKLTREELREVADIANNLLAMMDAA